MLDSFCNALHKIVRGILFAVLALMVAIVTVQIITRYLFFYSLSWSEELSRYLFAWLIFIGAALGIEDRSQICIDIVESLARGGIKRYIHFLQYCFSIAAVGILLFSSVMMMQFGARQLSPAMRIPMAAIYLCMPIGFSLMLFELFMKVILFFKHKDIIEEKGVE